MAIAFRSLTSQAYASRTNTTLTAPAGLADGDILVCAIVTAKATTAPTPTPPAGFTSFGTATSVSDSGSFNGRMNIFWKRAASESGSYTFTHAVASTTAILAAYSGALASGTPLGATANNTGNDLISTGTGITTTAANSYLLYCSHNWTGTASTPPAGMTERFDGLAYLADQLITTASATGSRVQNPNGNGASGDQWAVRMVELLVDTGGGGSVSGTLGTTLAAATTTATGTVLVQGTTAQTAAPATLAGTAQVQVTGTASLTAAAATGTLAGKVTVGGIVTTVLAPVVVVATGRVGSLGGMLDATLAPAALAAAGSVTTPPRTATLNVTLAPATLFSASLPQIAAGLNVSLDAATLLARGHVPANWVKSVPAGGIWQVVHGETVRLTEDGSVRITEDGLHYRITEQVFPISWNLDPRATGGWTKGLH